MGLERRGWLYNGGGNEIRMTHKKDLHTDEGGNSE